MDLNGDGFNDILSGSYSRTGQGGMAGLFQVLWGQEGGKFKAAAVLNGTDDEPLIIPIEKRDYQTENICTRPSAVDWDSDGDLDLVVGNFAGSFYLFKGEGKAKFDPAPELIKTSDNKPLKITGVHSDPFVIDWDGDGDLDILSGSSNGGVQWAENEAEQGQKRPVLNGFKPLIVAGQRPDYNSFTSEKDLTGPTTSTRIWVDDVNADGKLDIFVGDSVSLRSPANGLNAAEVKEKQAAWQKELNSVMAELRKAGTDAKARETAMKKYRELYTSKSEFIKEDRTGFVWLYVQK